MNIKAVFGDHDTAMVEIKLSVLQELVNYQIWRVKQNGSGLAGLSEAHAEIIHELHRHNLLESRLEGEPNNTPCQCGRCLNSSLRASLKPTAQDYPRTFGAIDLLNFDEPLQLRLKSRLHQFINEDIKTPYQTLFTSANVIGAASTLNNLQSIFDYEHRMILTSLEETRRDLLVQNEISP